MSDKNDSWDAAKDFQSSKGDRPDSSKDFSRAEHQARNDYQDSGSHWGSLSRRDRSSKSDSPSRSSSDSDGESRVICTHLVKKGQIDRALWRADMEFTENLSEATIRGYHFWAIPYVKLMRRSSLAEQVILPFAKARAIEVGYLMGVRAKGSFFGKLVRLIGESACWIIGVCVSSQDWRSLYNSNAGEERA
jgi:hypothetical protein